MGIRGLAKITGYDIRAIPPEDAYNKYWYGAFDENGVLVAKAYSHEPRMALKALHTAIYKLH